MQYIIRSFNEANGQITVEYEGKWTYAIDLPVEDGLFPTGEKLEQLIQSFAPTWLIEREQVLAAGLANASEVHALVQPHESQVKETDPKAQDLLPLVDTAIEGDITFIKEIVNEVLASKGL